MWRYVLKRILLMIPVMLGVSFMIYCIMNLATGDIVDTKYADADLTAEEKAELRHEYGLDQPVVIRYFKYMGRFIFQGDLGTSYISGQSVFEAYFSKLGATVRLALAAEVVCFIISFPIGIISALKHGSLIDNGSMVLALLGLSIPNFWMGLMLIILFSLKLGWFPSGGDDGTLSCLILPALTIGTGRTAGLTRTIRSSMLDVIRQDYLLMARAKGSSESRVIFGHALKNAMIPIISIMGAQLIASLGGAALTETVFSWPGVGRLLIDSINSRDVPMVTGIMIIKTMALSIINLLVDLSFAFVDPRLKSHYARRRKKA